MDNNTNPEKLRNQPYRLGINVLIVLGLLTAAEYVASRFGVTLVWVFIFIALIKAFLVLRDYMHIGRLFKEEEVL
ncbi:MAG: hypothetical protein A2029_09390 [Chloroflexi bacterium RBG_19FT_COMBO_47_9]|nr:MAG: hypothetical protein A2029_09390 [Chloroflexi bacterium RBG_19FT_COMBO_47_9]